MNELSNLRNLHGMKVTITKAVNATGKIWAEGSTSYQTSSVFATNT